MNMRRTSVGKLHIGLAAVAGAFCVSSSFGQWIELNKENNRMVAATGVGLGDTQEKDYEWGDVNNNGWIDLVVMRKQPFTTAGKRRNVLFMNEGGILVDRTEEYASAADQSQIVTSPGWTEWDGTNGGVNYGTHPDYFPDKGFLSPTNDRAAVLFDMNNNGWLDIATAVTLSDGDPKHIGHPRIYANLGNDGSGNWQGFQFENARIPAMLSWSGQSGRNPRFCSVSAGDVTENGYPDLFFGDYDSSGAGGLNQPFGADFNDKFLANQGASNPGYFTDETTTRFSGNVPGKNQPFPVSAFGAANVIADVNLNGRNDIVKQTSLNNPLYVGIAYNNNATNPGNFTQSMYQVVAEAAPYFIRMGDLNNNGRLDAVVTDDGTDRFRLNLSTGSNGLVNWSNNGLLPEQSGATGGAQFGSNIVIADLNKNGWNDILIADVDVDIGGCNRNANIYRNTGNFNNLNSAFQNQNSVLGVSNLQGTFDFAVFDLNGNGWLDIIQGRCTGTNIWIQIPPFSVDFDYPLGLPDILDADVPTPVTIEVEATGGSIDAGSVQLHTSVEGAPWQSIVMTHQGGKVYTADLPAVECLESIAWYFSAAIESNAFTDPPSAPLNTFTALAAIDTAQTFEEDFDSTNGSFTVSNDPSLTQGAWQHGVPTGSTFFGDPAAPFGDADGGGMAWATCLGGTAGTCNVANGPTHLISPAFDFSAGPATIIYDRWMFCHNAHLPDRVDYLRTYVSNNGGDSWVFVHETSGTSGNWETVSFVVDDFVTRSANMKVRFSVADDGNDSITNAGIDNFRIEEFVCDEPGAPCPADLTGDGNVGVADLLDLLAAWGPNPGHAADLTCDGNVGVADLLALLAAWGPCPR